ncbi:MAG: hypothetical protein JO273_24410 [Methylobacteriaceae bacterium]|nr:hypothetical protein [Methylobacteriaceae bacterium]
MHQLAQSAQSALCRQLHKSIKARGKDRDRRTDHGKGQQRMRSARLNIGEAADKIMAEIDRIADCAEEDRNRQGQGFPEATFFGSQREYEQQASWQHQHGHIEEVAYGALVVRQRRNEIIAREEEGHPRTAKAGRFS